jgi:hypothetical protein
MATAIPLDAPRLDDAASVPSAERVREVDERFAGLPEYLRRAIAAAPMGPPWSEEEQRSLAAARAVEGEAIEVDPRLFHEELLRLTEGADPEAPIGSLPGAETLFERCRRT